MPRDCKDGNVTVKARLIDVVSGRKIWAYSAPGECTSEFIGAQFPMKLIDNIGGIAKVFAFGGECCAGRLEPRHRFDCLPQGIGDQLQVHCYLSGNCFSALCDGVGPKPILLDYDSGTGKWKSGGVLQMRSGSLSFEVDCDPLDANLFSMVVSGCHTGGSAPFGYLACPGDGVLSVFFTVPLGADCCQCNGISGSSLDITLVANCVHIARMARLIDIVDGIKVFAMAEKCFSNDNCCSSSTCSSVQCDLVMSISGGTPIDGTYNLILQATGSPPFNPGQVWTTPVPLGGILSVICHVNTIEIQVTCIICPYGITSVTVELPPKDAWDNLDVTVSMPLSILPPCPPAICLPGTAIVHITR